MSGSAARFTLLLGMMLAAACGTPPGEQHERRVADYLQTLLIERNWSTWSDYYAPSASINGSTFALQIMRGTADGLHFSFSDVTLEVIEQVSEVDHVATFFRIRGIHVQPFDGQPATRQPVELDGFVIDRFESERIVESRMLLDVWGLSRRVSGLAAEPRAE